MRSYGRRMAEVPGTAESEPVAPEAVELSPVPPELRDLPVEVVGVPPVAYANALPFDVVSPEDFERVCLTIIETIDAVREARLYGVRGQTDFGIDLVAWDDDGGVVLYQVKRYQRFTAEDLRAAVEAYRKGGGRSFRPKRFVLCVACSLDEGDRREVTDALFELRATYDFDVDLYDARQLTTRLRGHPEVIERFFGPGWVEAIARRTSRVPASVSSSDVFARAVLQGPLHALRLDGQLQKADDPQLSAAEKAVIVGRVAQTLEDKGFQTVAEGVRTRQARLLAEAGDVSAAAAILGRLAWSDLSIGRLLDADAAERELRDFDLEAGATWSTFRRVLRVVSQWYTGTDDGVGAVFELADQLEAEGNPYAESILEWACESAVAVRDFDALHGAAALVSGVIERRTRTSPNDERAVRLQCCLADLTNDWATLDTLARGGELEHGLASVVFARIARAAAHNRDPKRAILYLRQAIDQSCQAECFGDASKLVLAWVRVEVDYEVDEDTFSRQQLADSLKEAGSATVLATTESDRWGKDARAEGRLPMALAHLRQYLREAVRSGRLMSERYAERLLGETLLEAEEGDLGIRHLLRAGQHKEVERYLGAHVGWLDVISEMRSAPPWERATALATVVASAEFLPDDQVPTIAAVAVEATQDHGQSFFAPLVSLEAWRALAAISERLPPAVAERALDLLEPLIDREPSHYRHNDDEHVEIVLGIYRSHPHLAGRSAKHLARLLQQGDGLELDVFDKVSRDFTEDDVEVIAALERLADLDHGPALRLLAQLGSDHNRLREHATDAVRAAIARVAPADGRLVARSARELGVLARAVSEDDRDALLARLLAEVEDSRELERTRTEAAYAIINLSPCLGESVRDELFERLMAVAVGPAQHAALEETLQHGASHPLSTFRARLRWGSLQPAALRAASRVARTEDQRARVAIRGQEMLELVGGGLTRDVAHALLAVGPHVEGIDVLDLARSSASWVRQLAASLWAANPVRHSGVGDLLANDPDVTIRRKVAESLTLAAEQDPAAAARLREGLQSDPAWSVRIRTTR